MPRLYGDKYGAVPQKFTGRILIPKRKSPMPKGSPSPFRPVAARKTPRKRKSV